MELQIDTGSGKPIYRQLVDQIREAAARGKVEPGERLPSVRMLSRQLVVNPNTIASHIREPSTDARDRNATDSGNSADNKTSNR